MGLGGWLVDAVGRSLGGAEKENNIISTSIPYAGLTSYVEANYDHYMLGNSFNFMLIQFLLLRTNRLTIKLNYY